MFKNKAIAQKLGTVMIAGLMAVSAGVAVAAAPASATSCNSWLNEKEVTGLNQFQAGAQCSDIDGNRKVRAQLVRDGGPDYFSSYFTTEDKAYRTGWYTCYAGCTDAWQERAV